MRLFDAFILGCVLGILLYVAEDAYGETQNWEIRTGSIPPGLQQASVYYRLWSWDTGYTDWIWILDVESTSSAEFKPNNAAFNVTIEMEDAAGLCFGVGPIQMLPDANYTCGLTEGCHTE